MSQPASPILPIFGHLAAWLALQATASGLQLDRVQLEQDQEAHPRYPARLRNELLVVPEDADTTYYPGQRVELKLEGSLWLYLRQTPGEQHRTLLMTAADIVLGWFLTVPNPVADQGARVSWVRRPVLRSEQRHRFDDPRLRVSCAELRLEIEANTL